jgi:RNA polymerase sigma factor (sigma-70 family)
MSIDRDKVTELLKNYRSYQYAIRMYETTGWAAIGGTGYSELGMPRNSSFGPRAPVKFTCDSLADRLDYQQYKRAVEAVDGALKTLNDDEESVIRHKWMDDMTLAQIARRKNYSERTVKRMHKMALTKLAICLRFFDVPEIEQIPVA